MPAAQPSPRSNLTRRITPPHAEPSNLDELLTATQLAKRLSDRPHASTVLRWAIRGALIKTSEGPVRVLLPHRRAGQKYLFTVAWYLAWVHAQTELHAKARPEATPPRQRRRKRTSNGASGTPRPATSILTRYGLERMEQD